MKTLHDIDQTLNLDQLLNQNPLIIAGPCSIESEDQVLDTALKLSKYNIHILRGGAWKPRTRPGHFEGHGEVALQWLSKAKQITGLPVMVEVGTAQHVEHALNYNVDMVWLGARTTTNPFAVQEIADALTGIDIPVFVKNPINPDLDLWIGAVERIERAGIKKIIAIHRGFSTQLKSIYRNEPLWEIASNFKAQFPNIPLICDPSHMSGERRFLKEVIFKAKTLHYDGYMIESHHDPDSALSDKKQQITPDQLNDLLNETAVFQTETDKTAELHLNTLRTEINDIDKQLIALLEKRFQICRKIGSIKKDLNISILQSQRWNEILESRIKIAKEKEISGDLISSLFKLIHEESLRIQNEMINA